MSRLVVHLSLSTAMLCCEETCNAIFEIGPDNCPCCTGSSIMPLAPFLPTKIMPDLDCVAPV